MHEFVMIFRNESVGEIKLSPEGMLTVSKDWENWIGNIAAQNKLASRGARLGADGKTVRPGNVVTNGPYAEIKEIIGGLIIVRADSIEEATEMTNGCPILSVGGNIEIRNVIAMNN